MITSVVIPRHTTSSVPHPHVLYSINVSLDDGEPYEVLRRYSEFQALKTQPGDVYPIPPKHTMTTYLWPSVWVNDTLIAERKAVGLLNSLPHKDRKGFWPCEQTTPQPDPGTPFPYMTTRLSPLPLLTTPSGLRTLCLGPNKIDFSKFDILFFAFVTPNGTAGINWDDGSRDDLQKLVSSARSSGQATKIVLSVGGWSGSHWFSQAMSSTTNRTKLITTLVGVVNTYNLDGIDIDWEYPNAPGAGNPHSFADAENLLDFFKSLREVFGPSKIISAAVTQQPWLGPNGRPLANVAAYAKYMTYVNIMNYDAFGSGPNPGPNAPLGDLCGTNSQPEATAQAAYTQWTKAGMPASKLLLGLPLYGYVSQSTAEKLSGSLMPPSAHFFLRPGAHPRNPLNLPSRGGREAPEYFGDLSKLWGQQIGFIQLVDFGTLVKKPDGNYDAGNGYTMAWDDCSDSPVRDPLHILSVGMGAQALNPQYLFNKAKTTVVTYDDTWSIASKTKFVRKSGMGGCFTWSIDQDDGLALHSIIRANLGKA